MMYQIPGYEGLYWINESGVVINANGHPLKPAISKDGYLRLMLISPDNKRMNESIHRLVAKTLIDNPDPENKVVVMHLDNDKLNNHVSNLRWGTYQENSTQAVEDGLIHPYPKYYEYIVYNENTGEEVLCKGREELASLIGYEFISLKNMVGNGHIISKGPYKGFKIRKGRLIFIPYYNIT